MRKTLIFILLAMCPLVWAQEGGVNPEPDSIRVSEEQLDNQVTDTLRVLEVGTLQQQDSLMLDSIVPQEEAPMQVQEEVLPVEPAVMPFQELAEGRERPLVRYSPDFEFRDGIFANFESVKENNPIPAARIVTDEDMFDRDFFDKITARKEITIYDENGVKKVLLTENIWGYSRNGILYVNVGLSFHRISFLGSISHFVATITTYHPSHYDPYYYNPYYSNSYYYNRYSMPQTNVASSDLRQYLLDFETGDIMEYNVESVEVLLMKDPELADEYHSLRNRQQKQMKFVYIRRFNEKHPLYFPGN
jgi:hypothetical protein